MANTITLRLTDVATGQTVEHTGTARDTRAWLLDFAGKRGLRLTGSTGGGRGALKRPGSAEAVYRWEVL
jgi:hypothetical protein